jgi:hypothetical protein
VQVPESGSGKEEQWNDDTPRHQTGKSSAADFWKFIDLAVGPNRGVLPTPGEAGSRQ